MTATVIICLAIPLAVLVGIGIGHGERAKLRREIDSLRFSETVAWACLKRVAEEIEGCIITKPRASSQVVYAARDAGYEAWQVTRGPEGLQ